MKRFTRRKYENVALVAVRKERVIVLFWTRRGRKSTTLGSIAFDEMSVEAGRSVISASASLLLGTELVNMTVSATEQAILVANEAEAVQSVFESSAEEAQLDYRCANAETGTIYAGMTREDFADLYSSKRLEMRLYHSNVEYSRQLVIAPNPATARGWRGTVLRDEAGFTSTNLEIALREAVDPIFRDVPDLKMIYASNLCRDDRHPYFEMTMPPADAELSPNPAGNFYRGQNDILVHRVTLQDAYAAGHTLYDNKGEPMTYEAFSREPANRSQMPYNYDLEHVMGGSSAIDLLALLTAQQRGARDCACVYVESDLDFQHALDLLRGSLGEGRVAIGYDPATTTKETSNPSATTVTERNGTNRAQRLVIFWKEASPAVVRGRMRDIVRAVAGRPKGGAARRLLLAATNERYFCRTIRDDLVALIPTELIIESESIEVAGYDSKVNMKTYLGDCYAAAVNDNRYNLPAGEYFKADQRLTVKSGGRYECAVDSQTGAHGDSFVSGMLAEYGLMSAGAPMAEGVSQAPDSRTYDGGRHLAGAGRNIGGML